MQKQCCSQYIVWISLPANVKVFRAHDSGVFLPPATKLRQGNIFRSVCQQLSGGQHAWLHRGGMHGFIQGGVHGFIRGACVVLFGGHAWFYSGGMHGFIQWGACVVLFSRGGPVHGFFIFFGYNEIRSMSGRYASYWNAFLLKIISFY